MRSLQLFEVKDAVRLEQIESAARLLASAPRGLSAVFVDYLQLVQPPADSRRDIREQQVAQMSRRLKLLALTLDVPVFVLAQLNRESEKDDRKPRLSDLRESGAIEQDADRVWFLYAKENDPTVMLYQAKCRNGPAGIEAPFMFNRPIFKFTPQ
jgi:replicative DNA helicase